MDVAMTITYAFGVRKPRERSRAIILVVSVSINEDSANSTIRYSSLDRLLHNKHFSFYFCLQLERYMNFL